jgi:hypothetical protein
VNEDVPVRLGFMWNMQNLRVFVDGNLVSTVTRAQKRNFISLNFSPLRRVKFLRAAVKRTTINELLFNDTALVDMETVVKGNLDSYFLSCVAAKDESAVKSKTTVLTSDALSVADQCRALCFEQSNQVSFQFLFSFKVKQYLFF